MRFDSPTKRLRILLLVLAPLLLTFGFGQGNLALGETAECVDMHCSPQNPYGGRLTGSGGYVWEGDCIVEWSCYYDDGFTVHHYVTY